MFEGLAASRGWHVELYRDRDTPGKYIGSLLDSTSSLRSVIAFCINSKKRSSIKAASADLSDLPSIEDYCHSSVAVSLVELEVACACVVDRDVANLARQESLCIG
jgi:hypothetical protein